MRIERVLTKSVVSDRYVTHTFLINTEELLLKNVLFSCAVVCFSALRHCFNGALVNLECVLDVRWRNCRRRSCRATVSCWATWRRSTATLGLCTTAWHGTMASRGGQNWTCVCRPKACKRIKKQQKKTPTDSKPCVLNTGNVIFEAKTILTEMLL